MRWLLLLIPAILAAQPTGLTVENVSPQQSLVSYTAPSGAACTLAVTDNSGRGVTVWDVDSSKFASSNLDTSRSDTYVSGLFRRVTIGHRASEVASDGKFYSRSLQSNVSHTLTVTCGSAASASFTTANIPVGYTVPDPPDYNSSGFANTASPTVDWSSPTTPYIDHKTGFLLKPFTTPADWTMVTTGALFDAQYTASGWTNPANIISGSGGSLATTTGTTPIFAAVTAKPTLGINVNANNWQNLTVVGLRASLTGNGSDATASNRQVNICITVDSGQTCASATQTLTLNQTTNTTVCFPTCATALAAPFSSWGFTQFPQHNLVMPFSATVDTSGTAVTFTPSVSDGNLGGGFPMNLPANSRIVIGSTQYTVSSVGSASALTLGSSAGTQTGVSLKAMNFGLKIWKATATGTVNLTATYDLLYTTPPQMLIENGSSDQCEANTSNYTVDRTGATVSAYAARLCVVTFSGLGSALYLVKATGEAWIVGKPMVRYDANFLNTASASLSLGFSPFDKSTAKTLYGRAFDSSSKNTIAKIVYRGDGRAYDSGPMPDNSIAIPPNNSATGTSCSGGEALNANLCVTLLTPTAPGDQVSAVYTPAANGAFCGTNFSPVMVMNSYVVVKFTCQQDAIALFAYIDPSTGLVAHYSDTMWSRSGGRFGGLHTASPNVSTVYHMLSTNPLGSRGNSGPFAGPYQSKIDAVCRSVDGSGNCTSWDTGNTGISNTFNITCPTAICGSTLMDALLIRIHGEPCSSSGNSDETTHYPCPWDGTKSMLSALQVGDLLGDRSQANGGAGSELLLVKAITVNSTTNHEIWVQRGANGNAQGFSTFANGWSTMPFPSYSCNSTNWWFQSTSNTSPVLPDDCTIISHIDVGPSPTTGHYSIVQPQSAKYDVVADAGGFASAPNKSYGGFGDWQSLTAGTNWSEVLEYYDSIRQTQAAASELVWAADVRPYQGGTANDPGTGTSGAAVTVSNITASDASTVYKISNSLTWPYKLLPGEAWAGRYLLHDISPANVTTSTPYAYCVALASAECAPSAVAGDIVFYVPGKIASTACYSNQMEFAIPCIMPASPLGNWADQEYLARTNDAGVRRLTQSLSGPSRQFTYINWRPLPDATGGLFLNSFVDGIFPTMFYGSVPAWPGYDSGIYNGYQQTAFTLGSGAALAEIRFGYLENGSTSQFYCTKRAESCVTKASYSNSAPYNFITVDGHSGTSCTSGCTVNVPYLANHVLWWQEYRSSNGGSTWSSVGSPAPYLGVVSPIQQGFFLRGNQTTRGPVVQR
jgi:hypothetical protein